MRNAVPCSLGVIGYSGVRYVSSNPEHWISTPLGARLSSLTTPVTLTVDSWVVRSISSQSASETSLRPATACTTPPVRRTWRKAILPLERLLSIQPRSSTVWPMLRESSRRVVTGTAGTAEVAWLLMGAGLYSSYLRSEVSPIRHFRQRVGSG